MNVDMDFDWGDEGAHLRITETQRLRGIADAKKREAARQQQIEEAADDAEDAEARTDDFRGRCHWCGGILPAQPLYQRHHGSFCGPSCWDAFKEHAE